jgi:hypothetical protein
LSRRFGLAVLFSASKGRGVWSTFDDFAGRMETQPRKKKILKKILLHIQEQFDLFNNRLPMRYQTTLKNRIV